VLKSSYRDSAFLMRVTRELTRCPGIEEAVVLMGTPMNLELLARAGFHGIAELDAGPLDMVIALRAVEEAAFARAQAELDRLLGGNVAAGQGSARAAEVLGGLGGPGAESPRFASLPEALAAVPETDIVSVAVPGEYAAFVAHRALDHGKHVFLFSNNVSLEQERALKQRARDLGLLVMGPDCGTAILGGVGMGFANRVRRGPVGIVGASGTGIQEVSCLLHGMGVGISHAIGTGSRDLCSEVGAIMTRMGLALLADDEATKVLVLVAKRPSAEVADALHELLASLSKPVVVRFLGDPPRASEGNVYYARDLDETASRAAFLCGMGAAAEPPPEPTSPRGPTRRCIGLFGGGSLALEAVTIFRHHGLEVDVPNVPLQPTTPFPGEGHVIVDVGEDFYTVGRPHPMVDQTVRCALIEAAAADPGVGLLLLDLVLGDGAHPDPAPEIAQALARGRARRGDARFVCVASVCGTDEDPQHSTRQREVLRSAGVTVMRSSAQAAHACALGLNAATS